MPQDVAEFTIQGRVGNVNQLEKVTFVTVCSNYTRRDGDTSVVEPRWNNIVFFSHVSHDLAGVSKGDYVRILGDIRERSREIDGQTHYKTELIASEIKVLSKAQVDEREREQA